MSTLDDILRDFADDIPFALVEMDSGMGVASYSPDPDCDASAANAAYTDFV